MIDFKNVYTKLKNDVGNLQENHYILLKSFKKDRWIKVELLYSNFVVTEQGFKKQIYNFNFSDLKKLQKFLKELVDFEFPRSNKIWYSVGENKDA